MANNIVIQQGFQGVKFYKMRAGKTPDEIRQWCIENVTPFITGQSSPVRKAKFYRITQADLTLLICVHDLQDSDWSGVGRLNEFKDGDLTVEGPIFSFEV